MAVNASDDFRTAENIPAVTDRWQGNTQLSSSCHKCDQKK
jgi:hypothetical protein